MKHVKKISAKESSKRQSDKKVREALTKDSRKSRATCPEIH